MCPNYLSKIATLSWQHSCNQLVKNIHESGIIYEYLIIETFDGYDGVLDALEDALFDEYRRSEN